MAPPRPVAHLFGYDFLTYGDLQAMERWCTHPRRVCHGNATVSSKSSVANRGSTRARLPRLACNSTALAISISSQAQIYGLRNLPSEPGPAHVELRLLCRP